MGFYECREKGWKSEYYNDAIIWCILGYTVWYYDPYSLVPKVLLSD